MSRIHEALKKAASERNAQLGERAAHEQIDLSEAGLVEDVMAPKPSVDDIRRERPDIGRVSIEKFIGKCVQADWKIDPRFSVFAGEALYAHGAEKFRTLRSRLYQIAATRPLKRLLITSSVPEEGKTFVSSNLAQSIIRQEDKKVLLIDGDLRASRLHLTLGAAGTPGLSDYLRGEVEDYQAIQAGLQGKLCFIPGGNSVSNPSELLNGEKMKSLLDKMAPLFDWIILDSPPAIAVHDASTLADICDGILFVVRAGKTDYETARRAVAEFPEKSMLGVVLNGVEKRDVYGDYYYGYTAEKERTTAK